MNKPKQLINIAYLFEYPADTLFDLAPPKVLSKTARITCRVCEKPAEVPIDVTGLLCDLCRHDLEATQQHVAEVFNLARQRVCEAWGVFEAALMHADPEVKTSWAKVETARRAVANEQATIERFQATWERRKAEGGAFAELLEQYEGLERISDECNRQFEWANRARAEVEAALDAQ